jgi:hypothetical protein
MERSKLAEARLFAFGDVPPFVIETYPAETLFRSSP